VMTSRRTGVVEVAYGLTMSSARTPSG
jgi:hypothetical protein